MLGLAYSNIEADKHMSWFQKLIPSRIRTEAKTRSQNIPEGLWSNCASCQAILYASELERSFYVCPRCQAHQRLPARKRLQQFFDEAGVEEIKIEEYQADKLKFKDSKKYRDRIAAAQKKTGEFDAMVAMQGTILGLPVVATAFEFSFIGGSMGSAVGNLFAKAGTIALEKKRPLICFSASGGARMQEAVISLMQMAKTSAVIAHLGREGLPFVSVMTDPTYGGVTASLAMLGDINIAEPKASIGFTGPRVIEQTVREKLPDDFQKSDFLLEHGMVDMIVDRREMRQTIARLLENFLHYRQSES